jgi:hypothetical protein
MDHPTRTSCIGCPSAHLPQHDNHGGSDKKTTTRITPTTKSSCFYSNYITSATATRQGKKTHDTGRDTTEEMQGKWESQIVITSSFWITPGPRMPITYIDRSSHGLQIHKSTSAEGNPPRTADPLDLQCFLPKTLDLSVLEPILRI